jgi:hypothetical protein
MDRPEENSERFITVSRETSKGYGGLHSFPRP